MPDRGGWVISQCSSMHSVLSSGWVSNGKGLSAKQSFSRHAESRWWKWVFFPFILWSLSMGWGGFQQTYKVCAWISQHLIHMQVFSNLGSYQFLPICSLGQRPLWPRTELGVGDIILCAVKWQFNLWRCLSKPVFIFCRQLSPFRNSTFGNSKSKSFVKNWVLCSPGNVSCTTREFLGNQLLSVGLFGWSSPLLSPPRPHSHLIIISRISPR